jgi:hypothetical protein
LQKHAHENLQGRMFLNIGKISSFGIYDVSHPMGRSVG